MKILVYKDIESKLLLFLLIERSICNLYLQFGSPCSGLHLSAWHHVGFKSCWIPIMEGVLLFVS